MGPARAAGSTGRAPAGCSRRSKRPRHQAPLWDKASASICGGRGALSWRIDSAAKTAVWNRGPSAVELHSANKSDGTAAFQKDSECWGVGFMPAGTRRGCGERASSSVRRCSPFGDAGKARLARLKNAAGMCGACPSEGRRKFLEARFGSQLLTAQFARPPLHRRPERCHYSRLTMALVSEPLGDPRFSRTRAEPDPTRASTQLPGCV
ncbi:uncharacterized protein PSANT_02112 [Moesziomyces antarcticus]|uniref:Uncharacterized protein n=1 Tax=Pseudozyma antarctica TaxID=84753 RepID=A0A5C3FLJ0_PSEA2|nr:uncharacterized protein PSANT_02112 [Moesziomyces antarcticus]